MILTLLLLLLFFSPLGVVKRLTRLVLRRLIAKLFSLVPPNSLRSKLRCAARLFGSHSKPLSASCRYCNFLLCKGQRALEGDELAAGLRDVIVLFKLTDDKDVFQKFYSRLLAKRLVFHASVSDDAEKQVLGDLKAVCGYAWRLCVGVTLVHSTRRFQL